jgi:hypothetical protein
LFGGRWFPGGRGAGAGLFGGGVNTGLFPGPGFTTYGGLTGAGGL